MPPDWQPKLEQKSYNNKLCQKFDLEEITHMIDNTKRSKAGGPENGITAEVYKCLRNYIGPILVDFFNLVLHTEKVPDEWRQGTITNIFKSGQRTDAGNYR